MSNEQTNLAVKNTKFKDNGAKLIFGDPILCAEFLREYVDIDLLKDVQPEDIKDISERFLPMWQEGRNSDTVKKIHLPHIAQKQSSTPQPNMNTDDTTAIPENDFSLFLIAIVEHQSKVYYDMSFKLLRYIVMILTDYENEQEKLHKGITKTKNFKYPPILPIVYYEGTGNWTAVKNFHERVHLSDILGKYIPNFEYLVVPLVSYTNQELIEKKDELSLIMLISKLREPSEFKELKEDIPTEYFENLSQNTPEYLLKLIGKIIAVFLYRMNVPRKEVEDFTDTIKERNFSMLFDSFQAYDVQETRRISKEEGIKEGLKEGRRALERFVNLTQALVKDYRTDDILRTTTDLEFREKLFEEYHL